MSKGFKRALKSRTLWIALVQYLFLFYYLSYANALIDGDYILIASTVILVAEILLRKKVSFLLGGAILASGWAVFCSFANGSGYGSAITQANLLISICLLATTKLTDKQRKRVILRMVLILLAIIILFFAKTEYKSYFLPILPYFPSDVRMSLNCIAMLTFYLLVFALEFIEMTVVKKKQKQILQLVVVALTLTHIYFSYARTSMLAAAVFIVLAVFCKYGNRKKTRTVFLVALLCSFAIVYVYTTLYSVGFLVDQKIFGKSFYTGREVIWKDALSMFWENPIVGFSNKTPFGPKNIYSAHNSLLAVLCYFGIFGFASTVAILYSAFKKVDCRKNPLIISALFSTLIIMCFETSITDWSLLLPFCLLFTRTEREEAQKL